MNDLRHIIPRDKADKGFADNLNKYSISEIRAYVPQLLEWLQDGNWPVARIVGNYFRSHVNEIEDEIVAILHTNDEVWKYWILKLVLNYEKVPNDKIMLEVKRIAEHPTFEEVEEEVHDTALEIYQIQNNQPCY